MSFSPPNQFAWLVAVALAFALGCGGSEDSTPLADDENANAESPQTADNLPKPGEPQIDSPRSEEFPRVEIVTTEGSFTIKLHRDRVPRTVDNFLTYVEQGFYDGTIFHEVTPDYAIVGGSHIIEDGKIREKPALVAIRNEAAHSLGNRIGTIAMARESHDADSARCQFFINLADNPSLDYAPDEDGVPLWQTAGYCAFGEVEGDALTVLNKIAHKPVTSRNELNRVPIEPITIINIRKL